MILDKFNIFVNDSKSPFAFTCRDKWNRHLEYDGQLVMCIGNVCSNCCQPFFEKLGSIPRFELSGSLSSISRAFYKEIYAELEKVLPGGYYKVIRSQVYPTYVVPGKSNDYFIHEQPRDWGTPVEDPKTYYYRIRSGYVEEDDEGYAEGYFELAAPLGSTKDLRMGKVNTIRKQEKTQTVFALGVLDVKNAQSSTGICGTHWGLFHYLIDGHHKMYAAAIDGKPVNLVSFITLDHGASNESELNELLEIMQEDEIGV